jgi:hypothetical protein
MVRFALPVVIMLVIAAAPASLGAQSPPQAAPGVTLALRDSLQQAVADARAAIDAVDVRKVADFAVGTRVDASIERARQSHHLIVTAAEFGRQNPASMTAQLILLLQLDGFQTQVDSVALNLEAAIARAAAADTDRLGAWADQLDNALDALSKVRMTLETVVTAMVTDGEKRLRDCGK